MDDDDPDAVANDDERLPTTPASSQTAQCVGVFRTEMTPGNRTSPAGLAAIRRTAQLTQTELARRMGIKQAAVSGLEAREDLLLSTLANYLTAAGATDVRISARLGATDIEVCLRAQPETAERLGQHHS
ncbi:hypothetical protein GOEFS_106_00580 [Gordonia effusa NBRC 100432]|uniref:HTH cro/C1-type domain-containing protein n=1 Tax=Gordonia effusa NBRC 100432 TaxID=1077974 RepID=H0R511_9ACTN|nr:helix-turn-helix domain-containing protein [Gordonia effusa]GAB20162.1 hypothetical protein GOEFS_106_00580 [Gordonia effusa NBRC 100432]